MTTAPVAPRSAATKPPREEDPRHPLHRLDALLDAGSMRHLTEPDDSGMLASTPSSAGAT